MLVNVTLAPFSYPKPSKCLFSKPINLSTILLDYMYVGFTASSGVVSNSLYVLGWSWNQNGKVQDLDPLKLPPLPKIEHQKKSVNKLVFIILIIIVLYFLLIISSVLFLRIKKYEELLEPWEKEFSPQRVSYKELYVATKAFGNSELLGVGGFGKVYKGVLPSMLEFFG